jgi:hypothetical protein
VQLVDDDEDGKIWVEREGEREGEEKSRGQQNRKREAEAAGGAAATAATGALYLLPPKVIAAAAVSLRFGWPRTERLGQATLTTTAKSVTISRNISHTNGLILRLSDHYGSIAISD